MSFPSTMRALQLREPGGLTEVQLPVPQPCADELLVRTAATTICTSDLNDITHNPFGGPLPRVLGHEGAGIVAAVGNEVKECMAGDRVAVHPVIPCRSCENCQRGLGHLCSRMGHLGLDRDGTFAEFFCIRADRVRRAPPGLDLATAALLEPVAVCLEAIERGRLQPGETVLIAGDGPFGIIMARLACRRAPRRVIVTGRHDFRLSQVAEAVTINDKRTPDLRRAIQTVTAGAGVDVAILAVGNQSALDVCVDSLRARGRLVVFSAVNGTAGVDLFKVHVQELEILGACNDQDLVDAALERLTDPGLRLGSLVTHRVPFAEWRRAFELAGRGKDEALKVALVFGDTQ
jgi:threonine dehydrogenase-like Zn-dependent dehydrogenase